MKMESAAEAQQGAETAVTETENQQITPAQIATLAQVTDDVKAPIPTSSLYLLYLAQTLQGWAHFGYRKCVDAVNHSKSHLKELFVLFRLL